MDTPSAATAYNAGDSSASPPTPPPTTPANRTVHGLASTAPEPAPRSSTTSQPPQPEQERASSSTEPPDPAAPPGRIALTTEDEIRIWFDGEAQPFAKRPPLRLEQPRWSPDGTRLAYIAGGTRILVLAYPAGTPVSEVVTDQPIEEFRWSPRGQELAFTIQITQCAWGMCTVNDDNGLWLADLAAGTSRRLAIGGERPTWDPTGRRIAYLQGRDLRIIPVAGGNSTLLHRFENRTLYDLEWGPSPWIAAIIGKPWGTLDGPKARLGLIPVRETEVPEDDFLLWERIFDAELGANIAWAPNRTSLAIGSSDGPLVASSVDDPLQPIGVGGETGAVTWSADGRWLAFDSERLSFITASAGGRVTSLGEGNQPHWQPN